MNKHIFCSQNNNDCIGKKSHTLWLGMSVGHRNKNNVWMRLHGLSSSVPGSLMKHKVGWELSKMDDSLAILSPLAPCVQPIWFYSLSDWCLHKFKNIFMNVLLSWIWADRANFSPLCVCQLCLGWLASSKPAVGQ